MCAPQHFSVDYTINPWMENNIGKADTALAMKQWTRLASHLAREAEIAFVNQEVGLPDMVFTANAGMSINKTVVVSQFAAKERRQEEQLFGPGSSEKDLRSRLGQGMSLSRVPVTPWLIPRAH